MNVSIMLLTYKRIDYAERTLRTTLDRLCLSDEHSLAVHIADDGSPPGYVERLVEIAGAYPRVTRTGWSNTGRKGYGANYNLATMHVHDWADLVLPLEDDWELTRPFSLDPIIAAMTERPDLFGCVRMGYVGHTQPLRATFVAAAGMQWLALDPDSEEPHVFSGHPRLETVGWARSVGPWPEGLGAGATEFAVAHLPAARRGVVWPVDLIHPRGDAWAHIGTVKAADVG